MEDRWRTMAITALAPIAWGSNYPITHHLLPADRPLFGAAARALPAALILLAFTRTRPHGSWWWKAAVLGTLNVGVFFVLIYVASQRLPSGLAATLMAMSPAALMLLAWPMLGDRPAGRALVGAAAGVLGVGLLVLDGGGGIDLVGVGASFAAMAMSSFGFVLGKRWRPPVPPLTFAAWQLAAGSLLLVPVAAAVEGAPPTPDAGMVLGLAFGTLVATALAYGAWFHGLQRLPAGTVGLIGLLNPVTGAAIGVGVLGEAFGLWQVVGAAMVLGGIAAGVGRGTSEEGRPRPRYRGGNPTAVERAQVGGDSGGRATSVEGCLPMSVRPSGRSSGRFPREWPESDTTRRGRLAETTSSTAPPDSSPSGATTAPV